MDILIIICLFGLIYSTLGLNKQNKDLDKKIKLNNYYTNISKNNYQFINVIDEYQKKYQNKDIVGILNIKKLNISSLIMQGNDNTYYLNHLENKEDSIYGSLMLDYRTNFDNSKINIIYGHMSNSRATPFTELEKYFSHNYQDIEIIGENSNYHYEVFSVFKVKKQETRHLKVYFNDDREYLEHLNWFKKLSIYQTNISLNYSDKILILQTCTKNSDEFILVVAKKI